MRIRNFEDEMFLIAIWYEGPWAKMSNGCYGLKKDGTLLWDIPANPKGLRWALARLAKWADERDRLWRAKYALKRKDPPRVWKRT